MSQTPVDEPLDPTRGEDPGHAAGPVPTAGGAPSAWTRIRPLVMRLHFYAGMLAGPFLLVAAITGLLYSLTPQLDPIVYRHELKVDTVGQQSLPLSQQVAAARAAHPEGSVASIRPPTASDETTQVVLSVTDVPEGYSRTVFVDPYTADVRGDLTTFGQWLPIRAWFDELHRNLHLGEVGRNYSELAASWMWIVALGGLALWVAHRKRAGALRRIAVPDRAKPGRRRTLSWHGAVGVWIIAGLLILSVTGLTWSRYAGESIANLRSELSWSTPSVDTALDPAATGTDTGGHHHGAAPAGDLPETQALAGIDVVARTTQDTGLTGPLWMTPPSSEGQAWQVSERKRRVPTSYDSISVDPVTGAVTDRSNFADWPFMAKMTNWTIDAHMGILFGLANQIVLALTMIGLITVIVRGYLMWWRRRPTTRRGLARAPRRGVLRELQPHEAIIAVAVLVLIGWFAPLFGISLAIFVALDIAWGLWSDRTRRRDDHTAPAA